MNPATTLPLPAADTGKKDARDFFAQLEALSMRSQQVVTAASHSPRNAPKGFPSTMRFGQLEAPRDHRFAPIEDMRFP